MPEITSRFSPGFITVAKVKIIKLKLYDVHCYQIKTWTNLGLPITLLTVTPGMRHRIDTLISCVVKLLTSRT